MLSSNWKRIHILHSEAKHLPDIDHSNPIRICLDLLHRFFPGFETQGFGRFFGWHSLTTRGADVFALRELMHPTELGLINHGFPLIRPKLEPLLLGGVYVRGGRLTSHNLFATDWCSSDHSCLMLVVFKSSNVFQAYSEMSSSLTEGIVPTVNDQPKKPNNCWNLWDTIGMSGRAWHVVKSKVIFLISGYEILFKSGNDHISQPSRYDVLWCGWFWMGLHGKTGPNKVHKLQTAVRTSWHYEFGLSLDAKVRSQPNLQQ